MKCVHRYTPHRRLLAKTLPSVRCRRYTCTVCLNRAGTVYNEMVFKMRANVREHRTNCYLKQLGRRRDTVTVFVAVHAFMLVECSKNV